MIPRGGVPIPKGVFARRLSRVQSLMRRHGVDALFVTPSTNFAYLTGLRPGRSERLIALLLPLEGKAAIVCPAFERERCRTSATGGDVVTWVEDEDPFAVVADWLARRRLARSRVALDPTTEYHTARRLAAGTPTLRVSDGADLFGEIRMVKSPEELSAMREAIRITEAALRTVPRTLRRGMRESDLGEHMVGVQNARGEDSWVLAQFGPTGAVPHHPGGARRLAKGDVVIVDTGTSRRGYWSDITRTFVHGAPGARAKRVFETVREAVRAGLAAVRPGAPAESIDAAARRVIERAGFGRHFIHRTGHGLGLDGHERPYMVHGDKTPLAPGMTFTIEPGIYLPGEFGCRIEEDVVVTTTGGEPLSTPQEELIEV